MTEHNTKDVSMDKPFALSYLDGECESNTSNTHTLVLEIFNFLFG